MAQQLSESTTRRIARFWPVVSAATAVVLTVGLGLIIVLRQSPFGVDAEWMEEIVEHRSPLWDVPAYVMSFLGGGWFGVIVLPLAIAAVLLITKRPWSAFYFILVSAVSAGAVQIIKKTLGRARPEDILVQADFGSFPSGHVANAATIAVALGFILKRTWVWVAGVVWIVLMALSRTYLGAHWISDTLGGALLGAGVAILIWAPFAHRLHAEVERQPRAR